MSVTAFRNVEVDSDHRQRISMGSFVSDVVCRRLNDVCIDIESVKTSVHNVKLEIVTFTIEGVL